MLVEDIDFGDEAERPKFSLRGKQQDWVDAVEEDLKTLSRLLVVAPGGVGKCLGRGTPVLMFDGRIKPVESICVGDVLMGPDSKPRSVITTCQGVNELYRITPVKGDSYVVNSQHVLSFKTTTGTDRNITWKGNKYGHAEVINIPVNEYLNANPNLLHCTKGWRTSVDFPPTELNDDLPPYFLGLWLGDGTGCHFAVSKPDEEIKQAMAEYAAFLGHDLREHFSSTGCPTYTITTHHGSHCGRGKHPNRALNALRDLGLLERKFIPHAYKTASREQRQQLLAGIMDSDGHRVNSGGGYDYITKSQELCEDVAFVARSLGLSAYWGPCEKRCQNGFSGTYYRMSISGDCEKLPLRIQRKKSAPRAQKKNVLVTGITINPIGAGEYFGFQLDGPDGLFLLGDFTVTHNSTVFAAIAARFHARGGKTLVLSNRDALVRQTAKRIASETGIDVEVEMGADSASPYAPIVVASIQTMGRVNRLTSFADTHFALVVADEAHFCLADQFQRVLNYFHYGAESLVQDWVRPEAETYTPKCAVIGFTATPDIGDRRNLGEFFQKRSVNYSYLDAVRDGWLVAPIQRSIPVKVDLRKYKATHTPHGTDFKSADLNEALIPIIEELAEQISIEAAQRKTIAFLPSVQCAKMMSDALSRRGMKSVYVTGECEDGDEKTDLFRSWGKGSVLCNAQIYNFGIDFPDVDCVAWLRATLSRAFYIQGLYRGTRILPGIVDGLQTAEERLAAIAASAKPNLLILDPLFVSDRIDLLDAYDLFTDKPEVKERMKQEGELTPDAAEKAERDFIKALEKEARKHARRQARTIDPLAHAVSLGDAALASWTPEAKWDMDPITEGQADFLRKHGVNPDPLKYKGLAQKVIGRLIMRMKTGLATPRQLEFLAKLGFPEDRAATMTIEQATSAIDAAKKEKGWK